MRNIAAISGLLLPTLLAVATGATLANDLRNAASGEVAAGIIVGGTILMGLILLLGCILNIGCTIMAAKRQERLWRLSALGIPLCITACTIILILMR